MGLRLETVTPPYTAFRFEVVLNAVSPPPGVVNPLCNAAFAECEGLEMTMEPKTVTSGGNNAVQTRLVGPVSYSQLTLRRGMTADLQLWTWFSHAGQPGHPATADGQVTMWDADGTPRVTFVLDGCLPVKMRGPSLHAKDGQVAIEELSLAYSRLTVRPAGAPALRLGAGLSVGGGLSASLTASASIDGLAVSASAGIAGSVDLDLG